MNYSAVHIHHTMLADRPRTEAYRRAIHEAVRPGDVVSDLGTGSGVMALFACQAGAARVYAVEEGDVIGLARQIALHNGFADRIVFIQGRSDRIEIPERCDVITSEFFSNFALEEGLLPTLLDARERFLKPGGHIIPAAVRLLCAPMTVHDAGALACFWDGGDYGIDFAPFIEMARNHRYFREIDPSERLADALVAAEIDFHETNVVEIDVRMRFSTKRDGTLFGFGGWFECDLSPSVTLSTGPDAPSTHWSPIFFPVDTPVDLGKGTIVEFELRSRNLQDLLIWDWTATVHGAGNPIRSTHSTFRAFPMASGRLREITLAGDAAITEEGRRFKAVLDRIGKGESLSTIADEITASGEGAFTREDAGRLIAALMRKGLIVNR